MTVDDATIVSRIRGGDQAAFAELIRGCGRRLFRIVFQMVRNREEAEDIVQETFITAFEKIDTFRGESGVGAWLTAIALNKTRQLLGRRKILQWVSLDTVVLVVADPRPAPGGETADELRRALETAVLRLPFALRTAFVLHELEGLSHEEIASAMNCPVGTVWSHLSRAREKMREMLKRSGYEL